MRKLKHITLGGIQQKVFNLVLIMLTLWRWMGVNIIYYISGLQAIN